MKTWFSVKALVATAAAAAVAGATAAPSAEISIYDEIGLWGVSGADFVEAFNGIQGDNVTLHINSPGGSVFDALLMFNAMRASGKTVNVKIMGVAASAASYVAMVGTSIEMPENTFMMLHNPMAGAWGNADELRATAEMLDTIGASLRTTYAKRTGMEPEAVAEMLSKDTWLSAQDCLDMKLCDAVTPAIAAQARFELDRKGIPPQVLALFKQPDAGPPVATTTPFAEQVRARLDAAGLAEFAGVFALDERIQTSETLATAIADAREIQALCRVVGKPDAAGPAITARKAIADVRAELIAARVAADKAIHIDTAPPKGAASEGTKPTFSVNAFWNDIHRSTTK